MSDTPLMTDEHIRSIKRKIDNQPNSWPFAKARDVEFARSIEAEARAPFLVECARLTAEQAVMRQWIAEVLPVLGSIDSEGECHALDFIVSHQLLRSLVESGHRLVDGGPDDLLAGVE